jgi:hypothetical protein
MPVRIRPLKPYSSCAAAKARRDLKRSGTAPMTDKPHTDKPRMETFGIPGTKVVTSRIGLGTWAIGGWMWGGTDEAESIRTIDAALDRGITLSIRRQSTASAVPMKSSARRWRKAAGAPAWCWPPRLRSIGRTSSRSAMAAAPAS